MVGFFFSPFPPFFFSYPHTLLSACILLPGPSDPCMSIFFFFCVRRGVHGCCFFSLPLPRETSFSLRCLLTELTARAVFSFLVAALGTRFPYFQWLFRIRPRVSFLLAPSFFDADSSLFLLLPWEFFPFPFIFFACCFSTHSWNTFPLRFVPSGQAPLFDDKVVKPLPPCRFYLKNLAV